MPRPSLTPCCHRKPSRPLMPGPMKHRPLYLWTSHGHRKSFWGLIQADRKIHTASGPSNNALLKWTDHPSCAGALLTSKLLFLPLLQNTIWFWASDITSLNIPLNELQMTLHKLWVVPHAVQPTIPIFSRPTAKSHIITRVLLWWDYRSWTTKIVISEASVNKCYEIQPENHDAWEAELLEFNIFPSEWWFFMVALIWIYFFWYEYTYFTASWFNIHINCVKMVEQILLLKV